MPLRHTVRTFIGIAAPMLIVVALWQIFLRPLPALLEPLGIDFKLVSIGLLSVFSYFLWRSVSELVNQQHSTPLDSSDLNQLWLFITTIVFGLGIASSLGLFFNRGGFLIGLVGGGLLGYQIGFYILPIIQRGEIPLSVLIPFELVTLFGAIVLLSLYLEIRLGFVLVNLTVGCLIGTLLGYLSAVISGFSKLSGLISVVCFSVLFVTYTL